jgi:hypothetical protein
MRDYEKMSDQELLAAILEGDEAALAEYTRRYRDQIKIAHILAVEELRRRKRRKK